MKLEKKHDKLKKVHPQTKLYQIALESWRVQRFLLTWISRSVSQMHSGVELGFLTALWGWPLDIAPPEIGDAEIFIFGPSLKAKSFKSAILIDQ